MNERNSLRLRAQEILLADPVGMSTREAMKRALAERFKDDPAGLLEFAATSSDSLLKDLRQRTYELQEPGDLTLFDPPPVIGITTPEGDFIVSTEVATVGQVRQWERERKQWLATQALRGKRFREQSLEPIADVPDDTPWAEARLILRDRRVEQLDQMAAAARDPLNIYTEEGRAKRAEILAAVDANMRIYQAELNHGVSHDEAARKYEIAHAELEAWIREHLGLTDEQVTDVVGKYRQLPPPGDAS